MKQQQYRTIKKDGSLNIYFKKKLSLGDLYHDLLKASWKIFIAIFTGVFVLINTFFGFIYYLLPMGQLEGLQKENSFDRYLESFFFSVQTFGTIGYGRISPLGVAANFVVTLESYTSLFVVALLTGLIFARFARPSAKIMFSNSAVIRDFDGIPCFMFRMANGRQNYVTDAHVNVTLALDDPQSGFRTFSELKLERDSSPLFALSWTISHDIVPGSPLYGLSMDDWRAVNAEIVVTFNGIDATLSQLMHAKSSYVADEVFINYDFEDVLTRNLAGEAQIMLEKFHHVKALPKL